MSYKIRVCGSDDLFECEDGNVIRLLGAVREIPDSCHHITLKAGITLLLPVLYLDQKVKTKRLYKTNKHFAGTM